MYFERLNIISGLKDMKKIIKIVKRSGQNPWSFQKTRRFKRRPWQQPTAHMKRVKRKRMGNVIHGFTLYIYMAQCNSRKKTGRPCSWLETLSTNVNFLSTAKLKVSIKNKSNYYWWLPIMRVNNTVTRCEFISELVVILKWLV